jgi:hypothetical protein
VTLRDYRAEDFPQLAYLLRDYYERVQGEDLFMTQYKVGAAFHTRADMMLAWYVGQGYEIPVLEAENGEIVGFGVAQVQFNTVMLVRHVFVPAEYEKQGWMVKLYEAARKGRPVRRVFFQTVKARPPKRLLDATAGRRDMILDDGKLITWEMRWDSEPIG